MNWNDNFSMCSHTSEPEYVLTLEKLMEMRKVMAETPAVLVEMRVSCDVSCEIVRAIDKLPKRIIYEHPFYLHPGIPVKEDGMVVRNRAILKFSDGSKRLMIKNELTGMFLTVGDNIPAVKKYLELIDTSKEWKHGQQIIA